MLQFSLLGALCMLGHAVAGVCGRARRCAPARSRIGVLAVYAWSLLSMLTTLARHHAAVVPAAAHADRAAVGRRGVRVRRGGAGVARRTGRHGRVSPGGRGAIGLIGAIAFSQDIPDVLRPDLTVAYTDTDGYGQRGDRRPPGAEKYYPASRRRHPEVTGRPRDQTVVLTADYSFLSYYPYYGLPGPDVALRQPPGRSSTSGPRRSRAGPKLKTADAVHPCAGHAALAAADGVPHAPRRPAVQSTPTRCGWPRTSTPTSPTSAATPSTLGRRPVHRPAFHRRRRSARSCWPSGIRVG